MRASGILLPIASLPSKYGIGSFSKAAYEFIDKLKAAGQKYWQILPLGTTGYGDSPYQSFSTFAGNPYFIDLDSLINNGLLTVEDCMLYDFGTDIRKIDYEKLYLSRFKLLNKAFQKADTNSNHEYLRFKEENSEWLYDYALFMAIKDKYSGVSYLNWDEDIRLRNECAMESYKAECKEEIEFHCFIQYLFSKQWFLLKKYANDNGIKIIGDIPIYVAMDSADTWANNKLFQLDENGLPIAVAGCPPDGFSVTGQLWGNPLYKWEYHNETGYKWWIDRIAYAFKLYDVVRIDHFRGFDEYYSIPYGMDTAVNGKWVKGPGIELFNEISKALGELNIIAEDLGYLTESVKKLLKDSKYPGMKVLQFAFDSREDSDYLPHNYSENCVVYTGTHDNDTTLGWYTSISSEDKNLSIDYMNNANSKEDVNWDLIRLAMSSVANLAIIPIQDYLNLGSEARINTPSTLGGNWQWRMCQDELDDKLLNKIYYITKIFGRL